MTVEEISEEFYASLRRRVYTTPKSYLDLISLYMTKLDRKRDEFKTNERRLANGVQKLEDTNSQIAELKGKLIEMQPKLETKNQELKIALVEVNRDKTIAEEIAEKVSKEAEEVNESKNKAKAIEDQSLAALAEAKPQLDAAEKAVSSLDKSSITEIKNFAQPPSGVVFVMSAIMIMLGQKKDWKSIKLYISDTGGFLNTLMNFSKDVEKVKDSTWKKVRKDYIDKPEFEYEEVVKVN